MEEVAVRKRSEVMLVSVVLWWNQNVYPQPILEYWTGTLTQ